MFFSRRLVLLFSVCSAVLTLSSCGKPDSVAYKDVQACKADASAHPLPYDAKTEFPKVDECQHSYDEAYQKWQKLSGYANAEDCQLNQGTECVRRDDGTWMSPMMGFLLGSIVSHHYQSTPVTIGRTLPCGTQNHISGAQVRACTSGGSAGRSFYAGTNRLDGLSILDNSTRGRFSFLGLRSGKITEVSSQSISERVASVAHSESLHSMSKTFSRGGFGRAGFAHASFGG